MNLGSGIITDIVICGILLFSTIMGAKKGVARTVVSFMQWFVCIIAGFILCDTVKGLLIDYTTTDDAINRYVLEKYAKFNRGQQPLSGYAGFVQRLG